MTGNFYEAVEKRRSIYSISKEAVISDDRLLEVIKLAVKHAPTAFNSQSGRVVLLLDENHDKLWDITTETLRKIVPPNSFQSTADKMASFKAGYGTVLFFEDESIVKGLQEKFELYKDNFPIWAQHSSGILQYLVWTALSEEGYGASLQHYNPLIDEEIKKEWQIPDSWKLVAQMPFGKPTGEPGEKSFEPLDKRIKVFK